MKKSTIIDSVTNELSEKNNEEKEGKNWGKYDT